MTNIERILNLFDGVRRTFSEADFTTFGSGGLEHYLEHVRRTISEADSTTSPFELSGTRSSTSPKPEAKDQLRATSSNPGEKLEA